MHSSKSPEQANQSGGLAAQLRPSMLALATFAAFNASLHWIFSGPSSQWSNDASAVVGVGAIALTLLAFSVREVRGDRRCAWAGAATVLFSATALALVDWRRLGWTTLILVPLFLLPAIAKLAAGTRS